MTAVLSLLRGVNVGGHNSIKMAELVDLYRSLRLANPRSHIQSGNVLFCTPGKDLEGLAGRIPAAIEKRFGVRCEVVLRTTSELQQVIDCNPFASRPEMPPNKLHVHFLSAEPGPDAVTRLKALPPTPEELHLIGRELYIYYPNGAGQSKLSQTLDRALKVPGTARNWNTVTRLNELLSTHSSSS